MIAFSFCFHPSQDLFPWLSSKGFRGPSARAGPVLSQQLQHCSAAALFAGPGCQKQSETGVNVCDLSRGTSPQCPVQPHPAARLHCSPLTHRERKLQPGRALPIPIKALGAAGGLSTGHPSPHCPPPGLSPSGNSILLKCCSSICSPGTAQTRAHTHTQAAAASWGPQTIAVVRLGIRGLCSLCFEHVWYVWSQNI